MLCESIISDVCQWIKVTEKNSIPTIRLDMHIRILKVGKSAFFWDCTERDGNLRRDKQKTKKGSKYK